MSKKNVSLALSDAVNVTAHCKEVFPGPGLIDQSGSLRQTHFISMSATCLAASRLNGLQRPGAEDEGEMETACFQTGRAGTRRALGRAFFFLEAALEQLRRLVCLFLPIFPATWDLVQVHRCPTPYVELTFPPTGASSLLVHKTRTYNPPNSVMRLVVVAHLQVVKEFRRHKGGS